ncbi:MAG: hypothetical protein IIX02_06035 [Clostridia bacterium]|nr:hypothetical protein [Clostridia bacterium]
MSNQNPNKNAVDSQNKIYRLLSIFIAVFSLITLFLPIKAFNGSKISTHMSFGLLGQMFDTPHRRGGFLPMLGSPASFTTRLASYAVYAFVFALIATLVLAILAIIFSAKAAPNSKKTAILTKIAVYLFTFTNAAYALSVTVITAYVHSVGFTFDITTIILTIVGALAYLFLLHEDHGKKTWFYVAQFALSLLVLAMVMLAFLQKQDVVAKALSVRRLYKLIAFACLAGIVAIAVLFSLCIFYPAKARLDVIIPLMVTLVQVGVVVLTALIGLVAKIRFKEYAIFTLVAAILSLLQLLGNCIWVLVVKQEEPETANVPLKELGKDEYIEAVPYTGGPVQGIYVAEVIEENNTQAPAEEKPATEETSTEETPTTENAETVDNAETAQAPTVTDAFIATLTEEEKAQFTDLYINKTVSMPGIPDYVVGENNKVFFNKVFIYLGQYRQNIPETLLAKMYDYSLTI